jgi:RimJ/RimL family protein N-acetyltransferase
VSSAALQLRPLAAADAATIAGWPPYRGDAAPLDYALRRGGWLDTFPAGAKTVHLGVCSRRRSAARLVAFSLLTDITREAAEFYIAVHPDELGRGIGRRATELVLDHARRDLGLSRVYLKVRTWHERAIQLYESVGFTRTGETEVDIQGNPVHFLIMEIDLRRGTGPLAGRSGNCEPS